MKRFYFFGEEVVPKIKHDKVVGELESKLLKAEYDKKNQEFAYKELAVEKDRIDALLNEYQRKSPARGHNGRFQKRAK